MELARMYFSFLSEMITWMIVSCVFFIPVFAVTVFVLRLWIQRRSKTLLPHLRQCCSDGEKPVVVAFFHPYCNAGGGGERVLWMAITAVQTRYPQVKCVVYSGDVGVTGPDILQRVRERFNLVLPKPVEFIFLKKRKWVEASKYPMFTLLGQSLGSLILGWEALLAFVPDVYVDSMGYAFTLPLFRYFGGCKVGCYVHYPTISTDMLQRVSQREAAYNNPGIVSRSSILTSIKVLYYRFFAYIYGWAGKRSDIVMVNSTWTYGHIKSLWKCENRTSIVFPPCDIATFSTIPLERSCESSINIVSIAQFRPEKNHPLQIQAFKEFLLSKSEKEKSKFKLLLVGSCRDSNDAKRVDSLKSLCEELEVTEFVDFKLNVSFNELKQLMASSLIGLHTMLDEHFGIGIVELMAAGCVVLAHNSGGPKLDIVVPYHENITGYLATDVQAYADAMETICNLSDSKRIQIQESARQWIQRFSDSEFRQNFVAALDPLLKSR